MAKTATVAPASNDAILAALLNRTASPSSMSRLADIAVDTLSSLSLGVTEVVGRSIGGVGDVWADTDAVSKVDTLFYRKRMLESCARRNGISVEAMAALIK
jgi:hypothetical protein